MFLYYVPNLSAEALKNGDDFQCSALPTGLAIVLADVTKMARDVVLNPVRSGIGPGGTSGVVIAPSSRHFGSPKTACYQPQIQDWSPVGDAANPDYWIGVNRDQLPSPLHLERRVQVPGHPVKDTSDREWTVPIARMPGDQFGWLPQYFEFNEISGAVESLLKDEQRPLWELGGKVWDWYNRDWEAQSESAKDSTAIDGPDGSVAPEARAERPDFNWLAKTALEILQANYRVGPAELRMLRMTGGPVLAQETIFAITQTFIGYDLIDEATKKKRAKPESLAPNGSPSTLGESTPLGVQPTGQATAHSTSQLG